jgi:hypothetical protein
MNTILEIISIVLLVIGVSGFIIAIISMASDIEKIKNKLGMK